jgi:branched-chain amino acid transport system substrate-binding protein
MFGVLSGFAIGVGLILAPSAGHAADPEPIKIVHVHAMTGPLQALTRQTQIGLMLGLEYATQGTMAVGDRKIQVVEKDDQLKPDLARALLVEAYSDEGAQIAVGDIASNVALAMLPVAQEYKRIFIVDPAGADSITGKAWNRYIFRTERSSTQDALALAQALGKPGVSIATLAQDYAYGRDATAAMRKALKGTGAELVFEEYAPFAAIDLSANALRLFDALKNRPARKIILVLWASQVDAVGKIKEQRPERFGIELAAPGNVFASMVAYKALPGMEGTTNYYFALPHNPVNDWLVATHEKRFGGPPDFFVPGGMTAGIAIVTAIRKAGGSTDSEKLIAAMEGMKFETPKGEMLIRAEDHQALQSMYHFRIKVDPTVAWGIPELVDEIKIGDMNVPITNQR